MSLNISTEPLEPRQLILRVEVDQERVDAELRKAARKIAGQYQFPGFRRGKAPYSVIAQQVGLPALFNEFIEELGQEVYRQAIEESEIEPYATAQLDIESLEPLTYAFTVPLEPQVDLGDYRSLRVEPEEPEVTEEEVQEQLESYRSEQAEYGEVERPSKYGDLMTIDVKSVIPPAEGEENAEETIVLDETEWDVVPDQENPMEPPGFDEALLELKPGEEKEVDLQWPEDSQSIHAGKQAHFHVKVHKIQGEQLPELNDEFAQMIGPDFQTLDDLKENIRSTLYEERQQEAENAYLEKVLDTLVEQSTLDYPPAVVEDQIDTMLSEFERQIRQYGFDGLESFLQQTGQDMESYRENLRPQAEEIARRNLVISEIYQQEGFDVSDEEIEERIDRMVGQMSAGPTAPEEAELSETETADATEPEEAVQAEGTETEAAAQDELGQEAAGEGATEDETAEDETADSEAAEDENTRALRDLMRSGSGRSILESQILQEKALERLKAIARGEEVPPPQPRQEDDQEPDEAESDGATEAAATEEETEPSEETSG